MTGLERPEKNVSQPAKPTQRIRHGRWDPWFWTPPVVQTAGAGTGHGPSRGCLCLWLVTVALAAAGADGRLGARVRDHLDLQIQNAKQIARVLSFCHGGCKYSSDTYANLNTKTVSSLGLWLKMLLNAI